MKKLLIIEDEQNLRDQLKWGLGSEYMILEAADRHQGMELFISHAPKVVLLDLGLPPDQSGTSEGFLSLKWMVETRPLTKVVVLAGIGERETEYRAIGCGAYDYSPKPAELNALKIIISRAFHLSSIEEQKSRLQDALEQSSASIEGIAGQVAAIRELMNSLHRSAAWDLPGTAVRVRMPEPAAVAIEAGQRRMADMDPGRVAGASPVGSERELASPPGNLTLREVRDMVEKGMITAAFGNCGGSMAKASEMLGVSRPALYDLMKKHGLNKPAHHRE